MAAAGIYRRTGLGTEVLVLGAGTSSTPTPGGGGTTTLARVPLLTPGTALGTYSADTVPASAKYVDSVNGSNANTGTLASPWLTAEYALAAAPAGSTIVLRGVPGGSESNCRWIKEGRTESTLSNGLAITVSKAGMVLMNAPGEAVGFDGSSVISSASWTFDSASGFWWRSYTPLNWSPQYTVNQKANDPTAYSAAIANDDWTSLDGKDPGGNPAQDLYWRFVDPAGVFSAAAARPERCYRDGVQLAQVAKIGSLLPGRFFLDANTNRHWIADTPVGHVIEFTVLQKLFNWLGADQAMLGIGVRRFAGSQPLGGVMQAHRPRFRLQGNWFKDNAMTVMSWVGSNNGIGPYDSLSKANTWINTKNCHWRMTQCDRFLADGEDYVNGNDGGFNPAPSAGHWKVTRAQDTAVRYSRHRNIRLTDSPDIIGHGKGGWFDVQILRPTVHSCEFWGMGQKDVTYEMTHDLKHFNNLSDNAGTESVSMVDPGGNPYVRNNVILRSGANRGKPETEVLLTYYDNGAIHTGRDSRRITPPSYAYDSRYSTTQWAGGGGNEAVPPLEPFPMPSYINPTALDVQSNIVVQANVKALLFDEETAATGSGAVSYTAIAMAQDYNVWQLSSAISTPGTVNGQTLENDTFNYDDLTTSGGKTAKTITAVRALGFEAHGQLLAPTDPLPVDLATGNLTAAWEAQAANAAPLPVELATLIGVPTGTKRLGRIPWVRS